MAGLKPVIDKIEEVTGLLREFYEQKDGASLCSQLDGGHPLEKKVAEFRDKNIALLKEVDTLKPLVAKFDGIDPDAARAALADRNLSMTLRVRRER